MRFAPGGRHALSGTAGERHIAVWQLPDAQASKKARRAAAAAPSAANLSMDDPPAVLDARSCDADEVRRNVLSWHVWLSQRGLIVSNAEHMTA